MANWSMILPTYALKGSVNSSLFCCVFFFSSRRRHTRLQGDWSSDVCSSDLRYPFPDGSFKDLGYVSAPEGLPGYSFFWKSEDLGATWRLPLHLPATGNNPGQGIGGGDSHQAVGERTHNVFFVDLPGDCVTFNRSTDLGESFTTDPLGCGLEPGAIDDRQWVDTDENGAPGTVSGNVYISFIDGTNNTL